MARCDYRTALGLLATCLTAAGVATADVVPSAWAELKPLWVPRGVKQQFVPVQGRDFAEALQIKVEAKPAKPGDARVVLPTQEAAEQDQGFLISFEARAVGVPAGQVLVAFKAYSEPYTTSFEKLVQLSGDWQHYVVAGTSKAYYSPGAAQIELHLGQQVQTVEIAGFKVEPLNRAGATAGAASAAAGAGAPSGPSYYALIAQQLGSIGKGRFIAPDTEDAMLAKETSAATRVEDLRLSGLPFARARRAVVKEKTKEFWAANVGVTNTTPVRAGETVYVTFWARRGRAPEVADDGSPAQIEAHLKRQPPFTLFDGLKTHVGEQWTRFHLRGKVDKDCAPGEVQVIVCLGFKPQVVEVGGLAMAAFGPGANVAKIPQSPDAGK